jgi:predicted DNA-binding transcriptional regulator YafY
MKEFGGKLRSIRGTPYPEGDWIENDNDKIRLGFSASSKVELIAWILSLGEDARVIDPDWLVEEVVNKANRTAVLYQK